MNEYQETPVRKGGGLSALHKEDPMSKKDTPKDGKRTITVNPIVGEDLGRAQIDRARKIKEGIAKGKGKKKKR